MDSTMRHSIEKIHVTNTSNKSSSFTINLDGKNLIITGNNGSGKTVFLNKMFSILKDVIISTGNDYQIEFIKSEIERHSHTLANLSPGDGNYRFKKEKVLELTEKLEKRKMFDITFRNISELKKSYHEKKSIVRFFEATRQAKISSDGKITSLDSLSNEYSTYNLQNDSGVFFERYLVTTWNYALLQRGLNKIHEADRVEKWISEIKNDLQQLFEDPSLTLEFDVESLRIYIEQDGKDRYRLDQLSSGFSSILSVYADLLIRVELGNIERKDITGIVLIDEIDAHLHVTLQKKVFSFFKEAFPNVQFIISTHSPFVVQSVSDAVIFNLTTLEEMEDLSLYSYTSIIRGLLGEKSTSHLLQEKIEALANLVKSGDFNDIDYLEIMSDLEPYINDMDLRSKSIILSAKNKFIEKQQG
ncbi:AAA family ATPase [Serratia marcescens]|uniref:AAA family ATPase n=1 Tax=Serratia TaxID=613 RepID=UPI0027E50631|nr:ATP-binding protein [Serratia marcescens]MCS1373860.1 ATP-binding protein [Serratia marcescens]